MRAAAERKYGGIEVFAPQQQTRTDTSRKAEYMLIKSSNGQEIELNHYEVLIGRSPMCSILMEHDSIAQ